MLTFVWNAFFFIIALGLLVTIHEFGHFWVARRCGVKVERFSIGFGRALYSRTSRDGTEYILAMIPLGGYVQMVDERVAEVPDELKSVAFNNQPLWQRFAIVAAGPMANFLLAIVAYALMLMVGVMSFKPILGDITPDSAASQANLQSNQEVLSVNGQPTQDWNSFMLTLIAQVGEPNVNVMTRNNDGSQQEHHLDLSQWRINSEHAKSPLKAIGIQAFKPEITLTVNQVLPGTPASKARFQVGDKLLKINGQSLKSWAQFTDVIRHHAQQSLVVIVERHGQRVWLSLTPEIKNGMGYIGLSPKTNMPKDYVITRQFSPLEAFPKAVSQTWQTIRLTVDMLQKLVTGRVSVDTLSGPVSIAQGAGQTAHYGIAYFFGFLALVSVNLGILNLLPLPVLDGGHLLFFIVEAITRRPVSERIQEIGVRIGTSVLVVIMMFALFNDFMRL